MQFYIRVSKTHPGSKNHKEYKRQVEGEYLPQKRGWTRKFWIGKNIPNGEMYKYTITEEISGLSLCRGDNRREVMTRYRMILDGRTEEDLIKQVKNLKPVNELPDIPDGYMEGGE